MNQKGERQLIEVGKAKQALQRVRSWFCGDPSTEQDKLAQAVAKMCIEEIEKIKPVNAVELPCKIGDEVWGLKLYRDARIPKKGVVHQMYFGEDMTLCICVKKVCRGQWGRNIFAIREEAEAAIGGGSIHV